MRKYCLATALTAFLLLISSTFSTELRIQFVNVAPEAGLTFKHTNGASPEKLMPETFGSGVAWIDYDNDGFLDIYVTGYGSNQLYRNNGDGTFADVTARAGVSGGSWSSSAAWLDYDRAGWLDLYVVRYLDYDVKNAPYCGYKREGYRMYCDPQQFDGVPDLLYHNNKDGAFTEVSRKAGIANPAGKGLGVAVGDINLDGWPDIFVTNDGVRNFLYRNKGDGTFADVTYGAAVGFDMNGTPMAGMGVDIGDYDGDGKPDVFMTAFSRQYNTLFRNLGAWRFEDVTLQTGLESGFLTLAFGAKMLDFDSDGDLDLYATNGHVTDNVELYDPQLSYRQKDLLYENLGHGRFQDVSAQSGPAFQIRHVGRGAAIGDYDNDGDLDIVVADCGGPPLLFRNEGGNRKHWIIIRARGRESNRFGVGAKVRVTRGGRTLLCELNPSGSYLSTSDFRLHVGLGAEAIITKLEIEWPSGKKQTLEGVPSNQVLLLDESNAEGKSVATNSTDFK